ILIWPFRWLLFAITIARQFRLSRRKVSSKRRADATIEYANRVTAILRQHSSRLTSNPRVLAPRHQQRTAAAVARAAWPRGVAARSIESRPRARSGAVPRDANFLASAREIRASVSVPRSSISALIRLGLGSNRAETGSLRYLSSCDRGCAVEGG